MPDLLLQKTSSNSKSKESSEALKRRLSIWKNGQLDQLMFEEKTIQYRLLINDRVTTNKNKEALHPVNNVSINSEMVKDAIKKTRRAACPLGMEAESWRRILISGNFGNVGKDFRKSTAEMTKRQCQGKRFNYLVAFLACRLIPLNKQPGVRPVGIGEVLRRVIGKIVTELLRKDILKATGSLQLCAGQDTDTLREKCPNTVFFLVRISLYPD